MKACTSFIALQLTTLRDSTIENSINIGRRKFIIEWADGNNGRTANVVILHKQ